MDEYHRSATSSVAIITTVSNTEVALLDLLNWKLFVGNSNSSIARKSIEYRDSTNLMVLELDYYAGTSKDTSHFIVSFIYTRTEV